MHDRDEYLSILEKLYNRGSNPKLGLSRISELLDRVGFFRPSISIVQVVGTNGKGSTVAFLESLLLENGISSGLFTSPHLSSLRERIRINGQEVSEKEIVTAAKHVFLAAEGQKDEPSFFECMLAMAMWLFQKKSVSVAILEAGLGGRLDATTATRPDILGISTIDLDHQNILGSSIYEIAKEKVGASRPGQIVVSIPQVPKAALALKEAERTTGFKLIEAKRSLKPLGLFGDHQKINAGLALALLKELGIKTDEQKNDRALLSVNWPGRFELIDGQMPILLDGAHNPSGIRSLIEGLSMHPSIRQKPLVMIYGSLDGANKEKKVELLMGQDLRAVFLHEPKNPRALTADELKGLFLRQGFKGYLRRFHGLEEAKEEARKHSAVLLISGSLYTVGELRASLLSLGLDEKMPNF